ncbi:MAG: hypothetical protein NXY57DRAFT_898092 [Lentinula lateritia]|uniref:RING-type domain-containing protein n=1 Tax=Lentinula lateritia TaxID=40482 RepID=A0ABQ8VRA0_9AGAR|nr:hypothetical protein EV359DRAFT_73777 [Lentinula novae-zelandiae]KAJ3875221.1 hypothetical protein F5051DRAFT_67247 [Lentinula edodes]KAJ3930453.1 MAG: hypothetical protein NXY57DRAFT_898092 [Lentinula lateritia]KAJ4498841.1 hypothetical protein C8R41DRAFT_755733 [Lentinula lateritia]
MLTLLPGSYCDVCAEEFSSQCLPHTIPCGHVLCAGCCNSIVEKTSPRLSPVCPFCREQFTIDAVRLIRTDFSSSGWNTPRRLPKSLDMSPNDSVADLWSRREEKLLFSEGASSRTRDEARRLEDKVAKVAAKKCSVEEVTSLQQELEQWLKSASKLDDQTCSLYLSAALLRAILTNHVAHAEASKIAKSLEQNLKLKLEDFEKANKNLELELHRYRREYSQKVQECTSLRTEVSRVKALASTLGTIPSPPAESRPRAMSPPPSATPVSAPSLLRYNSLHARSTSMHASRPSTPAYSVRSHTPSLRSQTPAPMRLPTPSPQQIRSQTPAPPVPTRPRRLSLSSPPKMTRSVSEEKQEMHERWIPPRNPEDDISSVKPFRHSRAGSVTPKSRFARSPSPSRY